MVVTKIEGKDRKSDLGGDVVMVVVVEPRVSRR